MILLLGHAFQPRLSSLSIEERNNALIGAKAQTSITRNARIPQLCGYSRYVPRGRAKMAPFSRRGAYNVNTTRKPVICQFERMLVS